MKKVVVLKILGAFEKCLQAFLGTTDHGGVIAEEQTAEHRHHDDADEVGTATPLLRLFFHYLGLLSYLFFDSLLQRYAFCRRFALLYVTLLRIKCFKYVLVAQRPHQQPHPPRPLSLTPLTPSASPPLPPLQQPHPQPLSKGEGSNYLQGMNVLFLLLHDFIDRGQTNLIILKNE